MSHDFEKVEGRAEVFWRYIYVVNSATSESTKLDQCAVVHTSLSSGSRRLEVECKGQVFVYAGVLD